MTLQTSGAITLAQIQTEFKTGSVSLADVGSNSFEAYNVVDGVTAGFSIGGSGNVNNLYFTHSVNGIMNTITWLTLTAGSNPISMNEYYAGGTYVLSGTTGTNGAVPSSGQISMSQFYGTTGRTYANYWVRVTPTSGTFGPPGSATGTWLSLASPLGWFRSRASVGTSSVTFTLEIASDSAGTNILATATPTMLATVDS
jgi:hypothetical protein